MTTSTLKSTNILTNLPVEILDEIFGLLELRDVSRCVQTCRTLQAFLEPILYKDFTLDRENTFQTGEQKTATGKDSVEARQLPLFFRTLVSRPELGRHLKRLHYAGPSRRLKTRTLLNPRKGILNQAFRGPDKWRTVAPQQAMEGNLGKTFLKNDLKLLAKLNDEIQDQLDAMAGNSEEDEKMKGLEEQHMAALGVTRWALPEMMLQQGVTLSMLDLIILLSPHLRHLSISINVESIQRQPLRLYSLGIASMISQTGLASGSKSSFYSSYEDLKTPLFLTSSLSSLASFEFAILNQAPSAKDNALHAQDLTTLLYLAPNLEQCKIRFAGIQEVSWPTKVAQVDLASHPAFKALKSFTIAPTLPNVVQLNTWLSAMPALTSLQYHVNLDMDIEESQTLQCHDLRQALDHLSPSLEHLELLIGSDLSSSWMRIDDTPGGVVIGHLGFTLAKFQKLKSLAISLALLVGPSGSFSNPTSVHLQNSKPLAKLLPPTLERICIIEDNDGLGYAWRSSYTRQYYTQFFSTTTPKGTKRDVRRTHPSLRYFLLLKADFHSLTEAAYEDQERIIEACREELGITFDIREIGESTRAFPFEHGISGFSF